MGPVALIRYYLKESPKTNKAKRKKAEKEALKNEQNIEIPSYEELVAENKEDVPSLEFIIRDSDGKVIRKIEKSAAKGLHSLEWNLRLETTSPVLSERVSTGAGSLVPPGEYTIEMYLNLGKNECRLGINRPLK